VLLLDAGNAFWGPVPVTAQTKGSVIAQAMNMLAYDAMTIGPGDLQLGLETLRERETEAEFPILSANLVLEGSTEPIFTPYVVLEVGGRKIGILGLTGSGEMAMPMQLPGGDVVDLLDPFEVTRAHVAQMSAETDIVVVLSNLGMALQEQLAGAVPGVDLIVGGGSRTVLPEPRIVGGAVIVEAGFRGEWIGSTNIEIDSSGKITAAEGKPVLLDESHVDDPEMLAFVEAAKAEAAGSQ
jgi:2',3'-cyclic-nucleotide 2'-phosphodiesterase (5'-nucleotidase family)